MLLTFGEIMLRLSPPERQRFSQAVRFEVTFGGAEANVAVAAAQMGAAAAFVSKLPEHELADRALGELRGLGVDVSRVLRGGDRLGVYFLEQGASQRAGQVIYDRAGSAIATAAASEYRWEKRLQDVSWFHWSGITPALSPAAAQATSDACRAAHAAGIPVSFDLNFRAKLWTPEQAGQVLAPMMQWVHTCVTSAEEARSVFGLELLGEGTERDAYAARALTERFGFKRVALTQRQATLAETTAWSALLYTGGEIYQSRRYEIAIVDRVGAGDAFTGGLIFSLMRGDAPQEAVDFAVALSTLAHTVPGDYARVSLREVEGVLAGRSGGRVQR